MSARPMIRQQALDLPAPRQDSPAMNTTATSFDAIRPQVVAKYPYAVILNALPQAEARTLIGQWYDAQESRP